MKSKIDYSKLTSLPLAQTKEWVNFVNLHKPRALVVLYGDLLMVRRWLDKDIKLVVAAGFPFSSLDGALGFKELFDELDMVIDLEAYYKDSDLLKVSKQIEDTKKEIVDMILKVIIETSFMLEKEKQIPELVKLVENSGGDVIKTNTGRFPLQFDKTVPKNNMRNRTFEDLLKDIKGIKDWTKLPIKAAGGIKTLDECKKLLSLKVDYIGTSSDCWIEEKDD